MAEQDQLGRALALARQTLRGPEAMKERLRARLVVPPVSPAPPAAPTGADASAAGVRGALLGVGRRVLAHRYHLGTLLTLVGVGFGAGLWLGRQPNLGLDGDTARGPITNTASANGTSADGNHPVGSAGDSHVEADAVDGPAPARGAHITAGETTPPAPTSRATVFDTRRSHRSPRGATVGQQRAPHSRTSESSLHGGAPSGAPTAAHGSADDALVREVALLERIERAIRAGEGALARALLAELDSVVLVLALRDERAAARVLAQCIDVPVRGSARGADERASESRLARSAAERFLLQSPASVYADRIRASCALEPNQHGSNQQGSVEERRRGGHRAE